MTDLRKLANGESCTVRTAVCNYDATTTVLAHIRLSGISGMGLKSPDILGAWACSACHAYVDTHHDMATQIAFSHGVYRTIAILVKRGVILW